MKRKIEFRELKKRDKKELVRLFVDQEGYKDFFEKEKDVEIYTKEVMERVIGTCVYKAAAVIDDHIIGAVIGCSTKKLGLWRKLKEKFFFARLKIKKNNREVLKCLSELDRLEQELMERNQVTPQNVIVLFVIVKKYNNTQISKNLLRGWEMYIRKNNFISSYMVVNGNRTPESVGDYSKIDENSAMIQPKVQRFRFHKSLYQKFV